MNFLGGVLVIGAAIGACVLFPPFILVIVIVIGFAMMDG
jgi:hypothetical protein